MTDTVKIPRPQFQRRSGSASGRVEHDQRGNAVWVRTRATDSMELSVSPTLALIDDQPAVRSADAQRLKPRNAKPGVKKS